MHSVEPGRRTRPERSHPTPPAKGDETGDHGDRDDDLDVLAVVAHEVRSPLTAVHGYVQLLLRRLEAAGEGPLATYARQAAEESARAVDLVERLLDAARAQNGRFALDIEPIDLRSIVERAAGIAATLPGAPPLSVTADPGSFVVAADAYRLQQVLVNLLRNAVEHAPAGRIEVRLSRREASVAVSVIDDGPGTAGVDLDRIFEPFYRGDGASGNGLGLGLYIAREIVNLHGGELTICPGTTGGTVATMVLPTRTDRLVEDPGLLGAPDGRIGL